MSATDPVRRVRAWLAACLDNMPVSTEVPRDAHGLAAYVVVSPNGGYEDDFLDVPQLLVDCHAASDLSAYDPARAVAAHVRELPGADPWVSSATTGEPYRNSWARSTTPAGHCFSVACDLVINK